MTSYPIPNTGTPAAEVDVSFGLVLQQNGAGYLGYASDGVGLADYAGTLSRYLYDTGSPDHQVVYTFEASGNAGNRIILGWVDSNNYVFLRHDGTGNRRIYQRLAGVDSVITDQAPQNIGVRYKSRKVGTTITVRLASDDSVLVTATCDAAINGTRAGIATSTVGVLPRWLSNVVLQDNASEGGSASLSPASATHSHSAGSPTLAAKSTLAPVNATHSHLAGSPSLAAKSQIAPVGAMHGHNAGTPGLAAKSALTPASAVNGHNAGSPFLLVGGALAPVGMVHASLAGSPTLLASSALTPVSALHGHLASSPLLAAKSVLFPAGALHAHLSGSPMIGIGGTAMVPPDRMTLVLPRVERALVLQPVDRVLKLPAVNRALDLRAA